MKKPYKRSYPGATGARILSILLISERPLTCQEIAEKLGKDPSPTHESLRALHAADRIVKHKPSGHLGVTWGLP